MTMVIVPRVTINELMRAFTTNTPLTSPTRPPAQSDAKIAPGQPRPGCSPTASMPESMTTAPMDRSSWPRIRMRVNPMATTALRLAPFRMVVMLWVERKWGAKRARKQNRSASMINARCSLSRRIKFPLDMVEPVRTSMNWAVMGCFGMTHCMAAESSLVIHNQGNLRSIIVSSDFLNSSEYTMALFVKTPRLSKEGTDCQIAPEYSV
ncbi:MAG: hypothetical protein BWY09_00424 [Candidatus Hydrogenedentes bacterium ADurb.Bin179]|nr:MAG: hypothetical protein BWY09_00424 [Candidatus Hydrogenedentes bacterium ADurb.Bin179]